MPSQHEGQARDAEAPDAGNAVTSAGEEASVRRFPIVGIGASAGGLDAFKAFLAPLPDDTGMGFVFVQHLDPLHASLMADLLAGHTRMPVTQAVEGVEIEPNRIYLIPPGVSMAVADGKLRLTEPIERHGARMAFDFFLRSLAEDCGDRAMAVVLSGTGSDGADGVKAIKAKGGYAIAQDPADAGFDGMPKSAIKTRQVDLILPVAEIPGALIRQAARLSLRAAPPKLPGKPNGDKQFLEILELVREKTGQDFSLYKTGTLTRRIERRMALASLADAAAYVNMLRSDQAELDSLAQDLLINVTQFFRDATAFELLAAKIIPEMVAAQPLDRPVRIWVPGCSTRRGSLFPDNPVSGSDRADPSATSSFRSLPPTSTPHSVAFARAGIYGRETEQQIGPERLARFFSREGNGYRVVRDLREAVVFTVQDLLADPPFSRLDLISCRNVLIYLRADAQEQILSLFHFALRAAACCSSAGPRPSANSPTASNRSARAAASTAISPTAAPARSSSRRAARPGSAKRAGRPPSWRENGSAADQSRGTGVEACCSKPIAPASVLVDKKYEALFYSGGVDRYLQIVPGEANRNILVMARDGLGRNCGQRSKAPGKPAKLTWKRALRFDREGAVIGVKHRRPADSGRSLFLISFIEEPERAPETVRRACAGSRGHLANHPARTGTRCDPQRAECRDPRPGNLQSRTCEPSMKKPCPSTRNSSRPMRSWRPPRRSCKLSTRS